MGKELFDERMVCSISVVPTCSFGKIYFVAVAEYLETGEHICTEYYRCDQNNSTVKVQTLFDERKGDSINKVRKVTSELSHRDEIEFNKLDRYDINHTSDSLVSFTVREVLNHINLNSYILLDGKCPEMAVLLMEYANRGDDLPNDIWDYFEDPKDFIPDNEFPKELNAVERAEYAAKYFLEWLGKCHEWEESID